jgi:carbonic anhydrase
MSLDSIHEGIRLFQQREFPARQAQFARLGSGQNPKFLLVTCADSRIDPALLTQTDPGEIFVVRNAGNLVPPHSAGTGGEAATIEYGIRALGIEHIVVCGHTHCGAVAAFRDPSLAEGLVAVPSWLEHMGGALELETRVGSGDDALTNTVGANVLVQLNHLRTLPAVARGLKEGALTLHGWVYDFETGTVYLADAAGAFNPLDEDSRQEVA